MADPIDFYFEFASPYGYFASCRIDALAAKHGREVNWRAMLLGAAMKITGAKALVDLDGLRQPYFQRDFERCAGFYGVPFTRPEVMPMNSVAAVRAFYWLRERDADLAKRFAQGVYGRYFGEGKDVSAPEAVAEVAAGIGEDRDAVLAALQEQPVKDAARAATDAAIAAGVFGSPFVIADGEKFWGADRLEQLDRWLETGGW